MAVNFLETIKGFLKEELKPTTYDRDRVKQWFHNTENAQQIHISRGCGFDFYEPFGDDLTREITNFLKAELADFPTIELTTELFNEVQLVSDFLQPKELLVTLKDLNTLTGRIVAEKTIKNRGNLPTPQGKRGKADVYCYDKIFEWWSNQNFEAELPLKCFAISILAET